MLEKIYESQIEGEIFDTKKLSIEYNHIASKSLLLKFKCIFLSNRKSKHFKTNIKNKHKEIVLYCCTVAQKRCEKSVKIWDYK